METPVIDSLERISIFGNAGSTPKLVKVSGDDPTETCTGLDALDELLDALPLEDKAANEIRDLASSIFSFGAESGFRRGFRVAARLMVEIMETPEAPETGDGI